MFEQFEASYQTTGWNADTMHIYMSDSAYGLVTTPLSTRQGLKYGQTCTEHAGHRLFREPFEHNC